MRLETHKSMETHFKNTTAIDKRLQVVEQTSYPTGDTRTVRSPMKIDKEPTEHSSTFDDIRRP